jgi:ubiquinone/menaquinone biosynthesis C-methylase UbiE
MFSDPASNLEKLGITHGMKIVDVGAGSGFYTIEAAKLTGPSGRVYAVDVQKDLLERLRSQAGTVGVRNIEVVWANAEKIGGTKLRESIADRLIVSNVLSQIEKPDDFALEMKRLCKPGGKLMLIDWSETSPLSPQHLVSEQSAKTLFEKSGFKLDRNFNAGDHHYGLLFTR